MTRTRKILLGVGATFAGLITLGAIVGPPPAPAPAAPAAAAAPTTAVPPSAPAAPLPAAPAPVAAPDPPAASGPETVTVSYVIDGDTFVIGDGRKVRVLGIDACEAGTPGGKEATAFAKQSLTNPYNAPITLTTEPGIDTDRYGRSLRYVQLNGYDYGEGQIGYDHTGVDAGDNDANPAYLAKLRSLDDSFSMQSPKVGRDCSYALMSEPAPTGGGSDVDFGFGEDNGLPDGALTGGYCARKAWC